MARAEHLHAVGMRLRLVFPREVQVNIRDFITAEAKERLKRDVEAVLIKLLSAFGAHRVGQVGTAVDTVRHVEGAVFTFWATVMRRQGVNLGDARHIGDQRRANRTARADQIAVLQ